jgi:hypothetical protein
VNRHTEETLLRGARESDTEYLRSDGQSRLDGTKCSTAHLSEERVPIEERCIICLSLNPSRMMDPCVMILWCQR